MIEWILVFCIHVGGFDCEVIPGFANREECEQAISELSVLARPWDQQLQRAVCIERSQKQ